MPLLCLHIPLERVCLSDQSKHIKWSQHSVTSLEPDNANQFPLRPVLQMISLSVCFQSGQREPGNERAEQVEVAVLQGEQLALVTTWETT